MTATHTNGTAMNAMTSSINKQFPQGAAWVRADFHLHTKADKEFQYNGDENFYNSAYVDALEKAGIRLGIITNHNKFDFDEFKALRATARKKHIGLLPGVELAVSDGRAGVHVLIVFSDDWLDAGKDYINTFISGMFPGKTPEEYEHENGCSEKTLLQMVESLDGLSRGDYFLVFAHVEEPKGLWREVGMGKLAAWRDNRCDALRNRTLGFQKVRSYNKTDEADKPCKTKAKNALGAWYPAEVEGSDPKAIAEIGRGKASYLKLGALSFEAVKFALFDQAHRVRPELPAPRQAVVLRQVRFNGGALDGLTVPFSPSLNCLIGPRGNGKSAVIECLRHALGFREASDERYKSGLVDRMLSPAGKVVVEAVDEFGREVRVERERTGQPSVYLDGVYRDISPGSILKDILYFGQKDLSTRSESFDESFLEKLLADRIDPKPQQEAALMEGVRQAARQLKEALETTEKIAALQKEKNELDAQLQVFTDKGVDQRLANMTLFDGDRQAMVAWQQALKALGTNLKEAADWDEADAAFPVLKSQRSEPVAADLAAAKAQSDEARATAQAALQTLRVAYTAVGEALQKLAPVQEAMKQEMAELQKTLNEPQLDLGLFRKKKARLDQLVKLLAAGAQRAKTEQAARDLLGAAVNNLHDFWRERFTEREAEVRRLESELPADIRLQTVFKGKRRAFGEFLRSKFRGSGLQAVSYEAMEEAFVDGRELYQARTLLELEARLSENAALKVRSTLLEHLADFLSFRTPDETVILFHQKPLGDYSLGQRATVILHILMHLQRHPVIMIDQPEDDLDNETLYSHFIRQLLERKELTQFVFATHNPNIPVLGDAEQTIVCRKDGETFSFDHGSIDDKDIQQRIVTVMEGGEDAFRRRKEIYQLWKSSN
jgi:chromosome segregation protein